MPLLSLLDPKPLQMQSSHLSFQEYYAAKCIAGGKCVVSQPPWVWPAAWANTLKMGEGMGDEFGKGLVSAAGVTGDELDLTRRLSGNRPTVLQAITQLANGLRSLKCAVCHTPGSDLAAWTVHCLFNAPYLILWHLPPPVSPTSHSGSYS